MHYPKSTNYYFTYLLHAVREDGRIVGGEDWQEKVYYREDLYGRSS
jgi:hypothetical protein